MVKFIELVVLLTLWSILFISYEENWFTVEILGSSFTIDDLVFHFFTQIGFCVLISAFSQFYSRHKLVLFLRFYIFIIALCIIIFMTFGLQLQLYLQDFMQINVSGCFDIKITRNWTMENLSLGYDYLYNRCSYFEKVILNDKDYYIALVTKHQRPVTMEYLHAYIGRFVLLTDIFHMILGLAHIYVGWDLISNWTINRIVDGAPMPKSFMLFVFTGFSLMFGVLSNAWILADDPDIYELLKASLYVQGIDLDSYFRFFKIIILNLQFILDYLVGTMNLFL